MQAIKCDKHELLVYALLWGLLFVAPILGHYVSSDAEGRTLFGWTDVFFVWRQYVLFLVVFLIHNFFLAPLLVERQRRLLYLSLVALLLLAFVAVQCSGHPDVGRPADGYTKGVETPHGSMEPVTGHFRPGDMPPPGHRPGKAPRHKELRPPLLFGQQEVVATIILILMLGMNVGVKLYFRQQRDRQQLAQLEKQNLAQQLEYLRYQINPHFLMNTLNNIHALIDIDAERAKASIVGLSKIMRFVLYEGALQRVPLARELTFTQDYIQLMRMRLSDRVRVSVTMPERVPDCQIPPLVLITFVENAFKHGVSYRQESFIDVSVSVADGQLRFVCSNSRIPSTEEQHGGVGLRNVRQRLDLIYGNRYDLRIDNQPDTYNIELVIPL